MYSDASRRCSRSSTPIASMTLSMPLRGTSRPSCSTTNASSGHPSADARGVARQRSELGGVVAARARRRCAPGPRDTGRAGRDDPRDTRRRCDANSATSSSSISKRSSGKPSLSPWCRRRTRPSAWNVVTSGSGTRRVARSDAMPLMKKFAWTQSYGVAANASASASPNAGMYGSSASFGRCCAGPASTWMTRTAGRGVTTVGSSGLSRRVKTSTAMPRRDSSRATAAT